MGKGKRKSFQDIKVNDVHVMQSVMKLKLKDDFREWIHQHKSLMNCFKFIKNLQAAVFLGGGPQSLPIQTSLEMEMYNENSLKISPSLK